MADPAKPPVTTPQTEDSRHDDTIRAMDRSTAATAALAAAFRRAMITVDPETDANLEILRARGYVVYRQ